MPVLLFGTLDTKGIEIGFLRDRLSELGIATLVIDTSVLGQPQITPDVPRDDIFTAAGTTLTEIQKRADRGEAITLAANGLVALVQNKFPISQIQGVLGIGGSAGTTIATALMRALPFGIPKLMVSTLASGQVRPFVGPRDIIMMHAVTDISGINRVSRSILSSAAHAMAGMVEHALPPAPTDKPIITATMFGVTTPCVETCRAIVETKGYEVLVFHAVGTGGEAMESLVGDRLVAGVLDITTTELADELVGGVLSAGPDRLTAASRAGIPQVVSVGALDMVNFGPKETVPPQFADRQFYIHNANVTLMRTTPEENRQLGEIIARKLQGAQGPYHVLFPLKGVSAIDAGGKPFWDPAADRALHDALRANLPPEHFTVVDLHINDNAFARLAVDKLTELMN